MHACMHSPKGTFPKSPETRLYGFKRTRPGQDWSSDISSETVVCMFSCLDELYDLWWGFGLLMWDVLDGHANLCSIDSISPMYIDNICWHNMQYLPEAVRQWWTSIFLMPAAMLVVTGLYPAPESWYGQDNRVEINNWLDRSHEHHHQMYRIQHHVFPTYVKPCHNHTIP